MAADKLGISDLNKIRQELHSVKEKWLDIGMELKHVSPTELRKIAESHKQDYSICLNLMLLQWLESGEATWKILCEALQSSTVKEFHLSEQLQQKHCRSTLEPESNPAGKQQSKKSGQTSKSLKRPNTDDTTVIKAKRLKRLTPLPPNFTPEDFVRPQEPNRICFKCKKIPRTPLRPECCNTKLYCEPCSLKVKVCSTHQWENKFVRDDNLYIAVPKLKIKCPNWRDGCDFKDTVSNVYKEHLLECTKSNGGTRGAYAMPAQKFGNKGETTPTKVKLKGTAFDSKPDTKLQEEEEVWYMASEDLSNKTTSANTPVLTSPLDSPSHKDKHVMHLPHPPLKKPKPDVERLDLTFSTQQKSKSSAKVKSPVQPQSPIGLSALPKQQAKYPIDKYITQKFYSEKQVTFKSEQTQQQLVKCKYVGNGCPWTGELAKQSQHIIMCQYNPVESPIKTKTEIKQEEQTHPTFPVHSVKSPSYVKEEMLPRRALSGSDKEAQPCEYKAIGCKALVPLGRMKQHLQESVQQHLDLAIKRILLNEAKKIAK